MPTGRDKAGGRIALGHTTNRSAVSPWRYRSPRPEQYKSLHRNALRSLDEGYASRRNGPYHETGKVLCRRAGDRIAHLSRPSGAARKRLSHGQQSRNRTRQSHGGMLHALRREHNRTEGAAPSPNTDNANPTTF